MTPEQIQQFRNKLSSMLGSLTLISTIKANSKGKFQFELDDDFEKADNPRGYFVTEAPNKVAYDVTLGAVANGLLWNGSTAPTANQLKTIKNTEDARNHEKVVTIKQHMQAMDDANFNLLETTLKVEAMIPTHNYNAPSTLPEEQRLLYPVQSYKGYEDYREALATVPVESEAFPAVERNRMIRNLRTEHLYKNGLKDDVKKDQCIMTPIYRVV